MPPLSKQQRRRQKALLSNKTQVISEPLEITRLCQGLFFRMIWYYRTVKGKRVTCSAACAGCFAKRETIFRPRAWLCPETWERHKFTVQDVGTVLDAYHHMPLWCFVIWERLTVAKTAAKPSYSGPLALIWGGGTLAQTKLRKHKQATLEQLSVNTRSVMPVPTKYGPLRSVQFLTPSEYQEMHCDSMTEVAYNEWRRQMQTRSYARTFRWRGVELVPRFVQDNKDILVDRVIPKSAYDEDVKAFPVLQSVDYNPELLQVAGQWYMLTEESFYMRHQALR